MRPFLRLSAIDDQIRRLTTWRDVTRDVRDHAIRAQGGDPAGTNLLCDPAHLIDLAARVCQINDALATWVDYRKRFVAYFGDWAPHITGARVYPKPPEVPGRPRPGHTISVIVREIERAPAPVSAPVTFPRRDDPPAIRRRVDPRGRRPKWPASHPPATYAPPWIECWSSPLGSMKPFSDMLPTGMWTGSDDWAEF